ncbi:MAG: MarR family winged helix-turn-helix transcriptional regulator [Lachnospirales bacterium]
MKKVTNVNSLLVTIFNNVLKIETKALLEGPFDDLSITEVHTIDAIGLHDKKNMSEVAKKLDITLGTLTTAINNLVKKNYVKRSKDTIDKRVVFISLTSRGRLLYRVHENFHNNVVKTVLEGVSTEENEVLLSALRNLNSFLENEIAK